MRQAPIGKSSAVIAVMSQFPTDGAEQRPLAPHRKTTCLMSLLPRRSMLRASAIGVGVAALLLTGVALVWPGLWQLGPFKISLRNTRNLSFVVEGALLVWLATSDRVRKFVRAIRTTFSWQWQLVLALLIANVAVAVSAMLVYPQNLTDNFRAARDDVAESIQIKYGHEFAPLENFAARCCANLPADACILYHGFQEGWVFAYEVYPRRVYMLPSQWWRLAASCHLKPWFLYLPKDPLETYWNHALASNPTERQAFIRAHGITHEVFYDAEKPAACRWEAVR
jgi:hypothetical protein